MDKLVHDPKRPKQAMIPKMPLRAFGTKQDIADTALVLCSDSAKRITGIMLDRDGGLALGDAAADALTVKPRQPG